jgi:hypothetical protein
MAHYSLGYVSIRALRKAVQRHGASSAELAAIDRFEEFRAEQVDVERLRPLAELAGVELPTEPILTPKELLALLEARAPTR